MANQEQRRPGWSISDARDYADPGEPVSFCSDVLEITLTRIARNRSQTLPGCFASLVTTTMQPLWKPAQPQSEQRQLIPRDSFFLFLPRLSGKTILSASHSGQLSISLGLKVVSTVLNEIGNLVGSCQRGNLSCP